MPTSAAQLDHLVVMATTLDQGVAWCEATLGVTPGPGGEHPLMGTHNRLLSIASERFPNEWRAGAGSTWTTRPCAHASNRAAHS